MKKKKNQNFNLFHLENRKKKIIKKKRKKSPQKSQNIQKNHFLNILIYLLAFLTTH